MYRVYNKEMNSYLGERRIFNTFTKDEDKARLFRSTRGIIAAITNGYAGSYNPKQWTIEKLNKGEWLKVQ